MTKKSSNSNKSLSKDEEYLLKIRQAYEEHSPHMKRRAIGILKDDHYAEDAVHNVFEKLLKKKTYKLYGDGPRVAQYLSAAVRNESIRIYEKVYKHGYPQSIDNDTPLPSSMDIDNIVISKESLRDAADFVKETSPVYADPFIMYYFHEHTISEIAEMMNEKEETVRKGIYRLTIKVIEHLKEEK